MNLEKILTEIKSNSLRVTKARTAVAEILLRNDSTYLSAEDIFQKIMKKKGIKCDQVSVYRVLTTFEEIGIVKKSDFHNQASRYILNKSEAKASKHEHYFKCIKCLKIEPFSDCFISKKEKELEANGYRNLHHHLEITGLCPTCA